MKSMLIYQHWMDETHHCLKGYLHRSACIYNRMDLITVSTGTYS